MPGLQYRETIAIDSGGYPGEGVGSNGHTNWTDAAMSGTSSVSYYYHDSDYANDSNSSKVTVVITTTWTAVQNNDNSIDVTFSSVIDSLSRGDIRGNPGTVGRTITIYNKPGGSVVWGPQSTAVQTPATYISTDVPIATQTVHIAPQSEANLASLYYLNVMHGYEGRPLPNIGTDAMRMGVFFRNTLPPDYRPGKTWDGNIWQSHNREAGSYASTNLFDASAIANTSIVVSNNGQTITMPVVSTGNGLVMSNTTLAGLCPTLAVGDTVYLQMNTTSSVNKYIWLSNSNYLWHPTTARTITATDLGSNVGLYANRIDQGETIQVVISDMRIVRNAGVPFEPYSINYPAGAVDIWTSTSSKRTMRTQDGASGSNNPPEIYHTPGVKLNMRKIGEHA